MSCQFSWVDFVPSSFHLWKNVWGLKRKVIKAQITYLSGCKLYLVVHTLHACLNNSILVRLSQLVQFVMCGQQVDWVFEQQIAFKHEFQKS